MIIEVFNTTEKKLLPKKKIQKDILSVVAVEGFKPEGLIRVVLVDDKEIHRINIEFLQHNYPTDVITFKVSDEDETFEAEIYISVDTAIKQANEYSVSLEKELRRLAIHGALHLVGFDDATDELRNAMHLKENFYLERQ